MVALSPQAVADGGGGAYLDELVPSKEKFDRLVETVVCDGRRLVEKFGQPPVDPQKPVSEISQRLTTLEKIRKNIEVLWKEAWQQCVGKRSEPIGQSPSNSSSQGEVTPFEDEDHVTSSREPDSSVAKSSTENASEVKKVSQVSKESSDRFSELEGEAYEVREGCGHYVSGCGHHVMWMWSFLVVPSY